MTASKRTLTIAFGVAAVGVLLAAVAWACTILVGETVGTQAAGFGDTVAAEGTVFHGSARLPDPSRDDLQDDRPFGEQASPCTDFGSSDDNLLDPECVYALGVVNPAELDDHPGDEAVDGVPFVGGHSGSCHYETKESAERTGGDIVFATIGDATHLPDNSTEAGARKIAASGPLPSEDDGGDPMDTGRTVMCFYSTGFVGGEGDTSDADYLNGRKDGAATATIPQPFIVLDNS